MSGPRADLDALRDAAVELVAEQHGPCIHRARCGCRAKWISRFVVVVDALERAGWTVESPH